MNEGAALRAILPFNSFTGFHNEILALVRSEARKNFQFLHRIPPDRPAGLPAPHHLEGFFLSIPSPDSTTMKKYVDAVTGEVLFQFLHRIPRARNRDAHLARGRDLSIPSPDST